KATSCPPTPPQPCAVYEQSGFCAKHGVNKHRPLSFGKMTYTDMTTKPGLFLWLLVCLLPCIIQKPLQAQQRYTIKPKRSLVKTAEKSLFESATQYHLLKAQLAADRFPVTYYASEQRLLTSGSEPWVGGFYPG